MNNFESGKLRGDLKKSALLSFNETLNRRIVARSESLDHQLGVGSDALLVCRLELRLGILLELEIMIFKLKNTNNRLQ